MKKPFTLIVLLLGINILLLSARSVAQTSWKGVTSTNWHTASNWTNGVPTAALNAFVGDANFTGSFQPTITAAAVAKSLTVGGATVATLTIDNAFTVGDVGINPNGTIANTTITVTVNGNWNNNGTFVTGTSTINMNGAASVISGAAIQPFYNLTINGANVTTAGVSFINVSGNLTATFSAGFIMAAPVTLTMTGTNKTITGGNLVFNNLSIAGIITTASNATVNGDLNVGGSLVASSGVITLGGTGKSVSNSGVLSFRGLAVTGTVSTAADFTVSATMNCTGNFTATAGTIYFTNSSQIDGTINLYNLDINGISLSLATNAVVGIANAFTITAGILNVSTNTPNTVNYNGAGAQTVTGTSYNNLVFSNGNTKTAGAAINVLNSLTIDVGTTFNGGSFTHSLSGNWINNGIFAGATSTILFNGAANSTISGVTTFYNVTVGKSAAAVAVNLLSNISVSTINMATGNCNTGSNTLTITTNRSGGGIILGTITRQHTFIASTTYAFESANNTVSFAPGLSGLTSVTVNVVLAPVADFPNSGAIGRYYTLSIPTGTYNATLRLHYEDAELGGSDEAILQLWKYNGTSWAVVGKSSASTSLNYVDKTGITSISERWAISDRGSVFDWNGSVSSNWNTPANWTLVTGTNTSVPALTDTVQIGLVSFNNQPAISSVANAKNITLGSAKAVSLALNTGGSLNVHTNVMGNWGSNAIHTINGNNQNVTINGNLVLSDNTAGHDINLNIGSGNVTVGGSVTQSGNAAIAFTGGGILNIGKDYNYTSGAFTSGSGTVNYNGAGAQTVAGVTYHHLSVSKTGGSIAVLNAPVTLSGNLAVNNGELDIMSPVTTTNVAVSASATLIVSNTDLRITGTVANAGIFNANSAGIEMKGTSAQSIPAGAFQADLVKNLTINNHAGVSLAGIVAVTGVLNLADGQLSTGGNLVLKSTASGTARVAPVTGGSISGNVTIERYLANRRAWRLLTLPVAYSTNIYNAWQNGGVYQVGKGLFVSGPNPNPAVNGLDLSTYNNSSVKIFNTSTQLLQPVTDTKTTMLSSNTKDSSDNIGYFVFSRGDRDPANLVVTSSNATTISGSGKLQTGPQLFPASAVANKYTLIGNPYASPINFSLLAKNNLANRFIIWDPNLNQVGGYVTLDDVNIPGTYEPTPPSAQTNDINSGQAFFVQTIANGPASLGVMESNKSNIHVSSMNRPAAGTTASFRINLNLLDAGNLTSLADGTLVQFNDAFSTAIGWEDAEKFSNVNETVGISSNGTVLSIERKPAPVLDDTVFLKITKVTQRNYQLVFIPGSIDQTGLVPYLDDSYTHVLTPLSITDTSRVNFSVDAATASQASDRFKVIFKPIGTLPVEFTSIKAYRKNKGNAVEWKVENQQNIQQYELERSGEGINFTKQYTTAAINNNGATVDYAWQDDQPLNGSNFYRVRSISVDGVSKLSKTVEVKQLAGKEQVSVYPNPVVNNTIGLQLNNLAKGKYKVRILTIGGQLVYSTTINHLGGSAAESVTPANRLSVGLYKLELVDPSNHSTIISMNVN